MNLNGAKLPLLVPPNPSSNLTLTSPHGSNQSLNMQEQQQHALNSPRAPVSPGSTATTYNNESTLFMCASGTYNNLVPNPNNIGVHHSQSRDAVGHLATPNNSHYPPLYGNGASALPTSGAGRCRFMLLAYFLQFDSIQILIIIYRIWLHCLK